jgi:hypothetical protein
MASLNDAYNQLVIANQHLTAIDNELQTVNSSVQAVDADVQATTQAVQTGFSELYTLVNYTDQLLLYEIAQNNTIICYLAKIAQQTCALLNEAALQTAAQRAMREDLDDLRQLYELANPAAAVEEHRLEKLKEQVEKCCPPPVPEPPCTFEPCEQPGALPPPPGDGTFQIQAQPRTPRKRGTPSKRG